MDKPKRRGSFMNLNDVNKWLAKNNLPRLITEGNQISTKRIKSLRDESTFRHISCDVVTMIFTND
jgi:hypothetical protein